MFTVWSQNTEIHEEGEIVEESDKLWEIKNDDNNQNKNSINSHRHEVILAIVCLIMDITLTRESYSLDLN